VNSFLAALAVWVLACVVWGGFYLLIVIFS